MKYPLPWWIWLVGLLGLVGLAYCFGRYAAPTKTVTLDRVVDHTVAVADTHAEQQVRELTAQLEQLKLHSHTVHVVETHVDGTSTATTTRDVDVDRATKVNLDLSSVQVAATHAQVDASLETLHSVTVEHNAPQWFVGVVATISPGAPDPVGSISAGVIVGRHIVGPLALGLSVSVPVNKPVQVPTFGLALTVAF